MQNSGEIECQSSSDGRESLAEFIRFFVRVECIKVVVET